MRNQAAVAAISAIAAFSASEASAAPEVSNIRLPEGFTIEVFAPDVPNARSLALGEKGTLFVGTRREGKVWALRTRQDEEGRWHADGEPVAIAEDLNSPNGVAFRDGDLYVAEISRISRLVGIESRLDNPPAPETVNDSYPSATSHGWKHIAFGPDGWLYVPVGVPCNVCLEDGFGVLTRMKPDGSGKEVFASGIRNTVGFDWHPETGVLWFTDNGRDWLGDDRPPDELNRAPKAGMHFGFPFCHGGDLPDPEFGEQRACSEFTPPARKLGPHVAALGVVFYGGDSWPEKYRHQAFIAEHGSWNRSEKIGYRVTMVEVEDGEAKSYEPFAEGWLADGEVTGRPVDLLVLPDGSMLVSDDQQGAIYRIRWQGGA